MRVGHTNTNTPCSIHLPELTLQVAPLVIQGVLYQPYWKDKQDYKDDKMAPCVFRTVDHTHTKCDIYDYIWFSPILTIDIQCYFESPVRFTILQRLCTPLGMKGILYAFFYKVFTSAILANGAWDKYIFIGLFISSILNRPTGCMLVVQGEGGQGMATYLQGRRGITRVIPYVRRAGEADKEIS